MVKFSGFLTVFFCILLFCGCQSAEDATERRVKKAKKHFEMLSKRGINSQETYSLPACIQQGLKNNLDLSVEKLQKAVAQERKTAAILGMLPQLTYNYDFKSRSNEPGSTSIDNKTNQVSLQTSRSSKKVEHTNNIELAFSVIDFGMAYFNSVQAQDNIMLADFQTERVAQNLSYEIAKTYFQVAAIQDAIDTTKALLKRCRGFETIFKNLKDSHSLSQQRILDERKRFINLEKSLMVFQRNYETSCIRLRSLMGYLPLEEIKVDTKCLKAMKIENIPNINTLEKVALRKRPELNQLDIQSHINVVEVRKSILMMMPNVKLMVDWTRSSNPFLYHQSWWEIGCRAAYDLLKLPQKIARTASLNKKGEVLEARTMALSIAVMAQVRIAHANVMEAQKMFKFRDKTYRVYKKHLAFARKSFKSGSSLSKFELDRMELEAAEKRIRRTQSLGDCYLAYYRLLNTVGIKSFDSLNNQKGSELAANTAAIK